MKIIILLLFTFMSTLGFCAKKNGKPNLTDDIRIVAVDPSPEPENIKIEITFPERNQIVKSRPDIQIHTEGFAVGMNSDFYRNHEIPNNSQGQSVRVIIDELPYFGIYDTLYNILDESDLYFVETLTTVCPYTLRPGMHVMRTFPVRSYGEALKCRRCMDARIFYVGHTDTSINVDLRKPYITYNEPQGQFSYDPNGPIFLDYLVTGARLSADGYKVNLFIDGKLQQTFTTLGPFYIYGLAQGDHKIRLQLLDNQNKVVPGYFNDVEKTISLN